MTIPSVEIKYYPSYKKYFQGQKKYYLYITFMFIATLFWAHGYRNSTIRLMMTYISLVYPVVIVISLLGCVHRLNQVSINKEAIVIKSLGFNRAPILLKNIQRLDNISLYGISAVGLEYKNVTDLPISWRRKLRKKYSGWDEVLSSAFQSNGEPLTKLAIEHAIKHLKSKSV